MKKKDEIIEIAADLIHEYGYHNIGIKKILEEADIPKGSFYYYFDSKEDLGLQVIDYYIEMSKLLLSQVEKNIEGIQQFFAMYFQKFKENKCRKGCPIGNLILEMADINENFRLKLIEWTSLLEEEFTSILKESKLDLPLAPEKIAALLIINFEGVLMKAKLERSSAAVELFNDYVFNYLLKREELTDDK